MEQVNLMGGRVLASHLIGRVLTPRVFQERLQEGVATFGGWIADEKTKLFLIVEQPEQAPTAIAALARIGIDSVHGLLCTGLEAWREAGLPIDTLSTTSAQEAAQWLAQEDVHVLDECDEMEWAKKHIPGALHTYVGYLEDNLPPVPKSSRLVVHCSVGHHSGRAVSIFWRHGFNAIFNMLGGIKAWETLGLPLKASA